MLLLVLGAWDPFVGEQKDVRAGNERYQRRDYSGASDGYTRALPQLPAEPAVRFNLGAALFQLWKEAPDSPTKAKLLEAARQNWRAATDSPHADARLRSRAHYNLGNAAFDEGKVEDAVKEYRQALKADPQNEDARHNLELARLKKPPPQGGGQDKQQQDQPQKQDQQGSGPDQQQQQQQQEQQQEQQQPQQQQQQGEPPKPEPPPNQPQQSPQPQDGQPKQQPEADPLDDAERKLEALERRSRDLQVDKQKGKQRRSRRRVDDW